MLYGPLKADVGNVPNKTSIQYVAICLYLHVKTKGDLGTGHEAAASSGELLRVGLEDMLEVKLCQIQILDDLRQSNN